MGSGTVRIFRHRSELDCELAELALWEVKNLKKGSGKNDVVASAGGVGQGENVSAPGSVMVTYDEDRVKMLSDANQRKNRLSDVG